MNPLNPFAVWCGSLALVLAADIASKNNVRLILYLLHVHLAMVGTVFLVLGGVCYCIISRDLGFWKVAFFQLLAAFLLLLMELLLWR